MVGKPQLKYQIRVMDKATGEIIYQDDTHAGVLCTVEKVSKFGVEMEGTHQVMAWGHPIAEFYALDQLKKWFQKNADTFVDTLEQNGLVSGNTQALKDMLKK